MFIWQYIGYLGRWSDLLFAFVDVYRQINNAKEERK